MYPLPPHRPRWINFPVLAPRVETDPSQQTFFTADNADFADKYHPSKSSFAQGSTSTLGIRFIRVIRGGSISEHWPTAIQLTQTFFTADNADFADKYHPSKNSFAQGSTSTLGIRSIRVFRGGSIISAVQRDVFGSW